MTNKQKEDIDIVLCVAMFRCFNEQLYNIKGTHSKSLKQKFNRLIRISKSYDDEIIKRDGKGFCENNVKGLIESTKGH